MWGNILAITCTPLRCFPACYCLFSSLLQVLFHPLSPLVAVFPSFSSSLRLSESFLPLSCAGTKSDAIKCVEGRWLITCKHEGVTRPYTVVLTSSSVHLGRCERLSFYVSEFVNDPLSRHLAASEGSRVHKIGSIPGTGPKLKCFTTLGQCERKCSVCLGAGLPVFRTRC